MPQIFWIFLLQPNLFKKPLQNRMLLYNKASSQVLSQCFSTTLPILRAAKSYLTVLIPVQLCRMYSLVCNYQSLLYWYLMPEALWRGALLYKITAPLAQLLHAGKSYYPLNYTARRNICTCIYFSYATKMLQPEIWPFVSVNFTQFPL